jgi:hypothetical protein
MSSSSDLSDFFVNGGELISLDKNEELQKNLFIILMVEK